MQLFQIEYFIAVAETLSFTRGAQRANVVQSAVSAAIRHLERELDCQLFERRGRSVLLTAAGHALLPRAYAILAEVRSARNAVDATQGIVHGTVTLGTLVHPGPIDLLEVLHTLRREHPGMVIRLRQTIRGTASSLDDVRNGTLDLALVSSVRPTVPGLELAPLRSEPFVFVHSDQHRLAAQTTVELADTAGEPFIDFPEGWGNRSAIDALFTAHGLLRSVQTEVVDFAMAIGLVRRNLGVAMVPSSTVTDTRGLRVRGIIDADPQWRIQLARAAGRELSTAGKVLERKILDAAAGQAAVHPSGVAPDI